MMRVMLIDDHEAVRAGLAAVLDREHDLVAVASTEGNEELWPRFNHTKPDLVLLDYHLPGQSSLQICRRIKAMVPTPHVVFYSAYADATLAVPLRIAGADGLVSKGAPATELFEVLRRVGRGETVLPDVTADLVRATNTPLDERDRVVVRLLLDGASPADVAEVLGEDARSVRSSIDRLLGQLTRPDPGQPPASDDAAELAPHPGAR